MQSRQSSLNLIASRTSTDEFELVLGDTSPLGGSNWTVVKDKVTGTWFLQLQYPCKSSTYWVRSCRFKCQSISVRHSKILQLCISLSWSIAGVIEIDWSANKMHNLKIVSYPAGLVSKQNQYKNSKIYKTVMLMGMLVGSFVEIHRTLWAAGERCTPTQCFAARGAAAGSRSSSIENHSRLSIVFPNSQNGILVLFSIFSLWSKISKISFWSIRCNFMLQVPKGTDTRPGRPAWIVCSNSVDLMRQSDWGSVADVLQVMQKVWDSPKTLTLWISFWYFSFLL